MNRICVAAILLALLVSMACADTVTLKNGTKVEGTVIKFGTEYRVKQADGTTRTVLEKDVAAVTKGAAPIPAAMDSRFGAGGAAVQDQPIRQQQSPGSDTILYDGQRMSISEHREFIAALKGAITWTPRDPWSVMRESQFLKTLARYPRSLQANCALAFYHLRVLY